jgi:hypothetical protein
VDEERNVYSPDTGCKRQNGFISTPNGDAATTISPLFQPNAMVQDPTYMRSTINSKAQANAK